MKSLIRFSILAGSLLILSVIVQAHNVTWGYVGPYDRLLATDYVKMPSRWFVKQTAQIVYPPKGHVSYVTLTAIKVWDWGSPKEFGYASLVKGGPGHRNATIYLKSQSGKSLNFTIQYFGR